MTRLTRIKKKLEKLYPQAEQHKRNSLRQHIVSHPSISPIVQQLTCFERLVLCDFQLDQDRLLKLMQYTHELYEKYRELSDHFKDEPFIQSILLIEVIDCLKRFKRAKAFLEESCPWFNLNLNTVIDYEAAKGLILQDAHELIENCRNAPQYTRHAHPGALTRLYNFFKPKRVYDISAVIPLSSLEEYQRLLNQILIGLADQEQEPPSYDYIDFSEPDMMLTAPPPPYTR